MWIVIIVVVLVLAIGIGVGYLALSWSRLTSPFTADLRYDASYWVPIWGPGGGLDVDVWGYIYNHGSEDAVAIVHLRIFDGDDWHNYDVNAGIVPAGGHRYFDWSVSLDHGDENAVNVQYTITRG